MAYYRIPVPDRGLLVKQMKELKRMMKAWPRFYAVFHVEDKEIVQLNRRPDYTKYWLEVSDVPIKNWKESWHTRQEQQRNQRMKERMRRYREEERKRKDGEK